MHFDILTIFPELFESFRTTGVLGKAVDRGLIGIGVHNLRDWAGNKWCQLDDDPYGGGPGMVIQAPPVLAAVREFAFREPAPRTVLLSPRGRVFDQAMAEDFAQSKRLVVLCGRYEGFDERISEILNVDLEIVGLKAKTGEGVGPVGHEETISAQCVVLLGKSQFGKSQ